MNPYIEFAKWLISTWKGWYASHGTRIIGAITFAYSSVVSYLALISSSPDFDLLVTPKQFAILALVNVALGGATYKRGTTNARAEATKP